MKSDNRLCSIWPSNSNHGFHTVQRYVASLSKVHYQIARSIDGGEPRKSSVYSGSWVYGTTQFSLSSLWAASLVPSLPRGLACISRLFGCWKVIYIPAWRRGYLHCFLPSHYGQFLNHPVGVCHSFCYNPPTQPSTARCWHAFVLFFILVILGPLNPHHSNGIRSPNWQRFAAWSCPCQWTNHNSHHYVHRSSSADRLCGL